jgi:RNA polymerase-associated protein LEO1
MRSVEQSLDLYSLTTQKLYLMKVPAFLAIDPTAYSARTFQPPTKEHHSAAEPGPTFDPYKTALSTIRWRHSPSGGPEQSNARILRWSDGSLTVQVATDPQTQYVLQPRALAPPQINPPKPVPSAAIPRSKRKSTVYDPKDETYTYLCAPLQSAFFVRTLGKFTTSVQLQIPDQDESAENLEASIAAIAAKFANQNDAHKGPALTDFTGDPTQFEKEAQKLERELQKKQRKEDRDREKNVKFGRASRTGGLTIDSLEGETGRPRAPKAKGPRRARRDEYSDEEDELYGRRGGPEDTYDLEDDFVVNSDEDADEGGSEDAEGEDEEIDDIIERNERNQKRVSPKRGREDDDDAANPQGSPISRAKRRRVVSDDEDE